MDRVPNDDYGDLPAAMGPSRPLPPLLPLADESPVKTRANWRWMLGTFLTGVAGMALIGGALYTTFEGRAGLAVIPNFAGQDRGSTLTGGLRGAPKGDRLSAAKQGVSIKRIIHESIVTKVGAKEFIEVKPYAHVTSNLSLITSALTADLPPFDPLKLFSEAADEGAAAPQQARIESSGQITVTLASFSSEGRFAYADGIGPAEAENEVRETLELSLPSADSQLAFESLDPGHDAGLVDDIGNAALTDLETPEQGVNTELVTAITKLPGSSNLSEFADKTIVVSRGDTLTSLLLANGATPQESNTIAQTIEKGFAASKLLEGSELRLSFASDASAARLKPVRVSLFNNDRHIATAALAVTNDQSSYVALSEKDALLADDATVRVTRRRAPAQLYQSLYETGRGGALPESILARMMRIHVYDVDFKRQVQLGDSFEVFYIADDNEGNISGDPEILHTALTVRGETKKFYRFRTPDNGVVDFYDESGKSAKKFLIRKPMNGGVFRSAFGMRRHPILGYRKLHTGVDWAARRGTPIVAAGNGVIEKAKRTRGYGNYTLIRHSNGYKTAYAHQTRFAKGIVAGAKVRQGQVIGYVGSTGLSTGPHLHYEVIVNGRAVDPMRIRVPRGRTLQGRLLTAFQREKARIDWLMSQPPASSTRLASASNTRQR